MACKECGATESKPLDCNDDIPTGRLAYWFGTFKGSRDFMILGANMEYVYLTFDYPHFPAHLTDKYDYYCSKCYLKIMKELGCEVDEWKTDL